MDEHLRDQVERLTEESSMWRTQQILQENRWHELMALLPTCPVCKGRQWINDERTGYGVHDGYPCTGCSDGKVSVAQMAALWRAVHHEPAYEVLQSHDAVSLLVDLRHVR